MSVVAQMIVDAGAANGAQSMPPRVRTSGVVPALKPKRGLPPPAITASPVAGLPRVPKAALGGIPPALRKPAEDPWLAKRRSIPVAAPDEERAWQEALLRARAQIEVEQLATAQRAAERLAAEQRAANQLAAAQDERDWQQAIAHARARVADEEREWSTRISRARSEPSFLLDAPPARLPARQIGALHFWP